MSQLKRDLKTVKRTVSFFLPQTCCQFNGHKRKRKSGEERKTENETQRDRFHSIDSRRYTYEKQQTVINQITTKCTAEPVLLSVRLRSDPY